VSTCVVLVLWLFALRSDRFSLRFITCFIRWFKMVLLLVRMYDSIVYIYIYIYNDSLLFIKLLNILIRSDVHYYSTS
jgi:hypothetical protein